ncbi:MAG: ATP-binding protein [Anaerolineae bacterium]
MSEKEKTVSKHEYGTLSQRAQSLLGRSEGYELEFKETLQALEPEDMVAFANSPEGGVVLIGVREVETENGRQCGEVVGCAVGDAEKLSILNRAESCVPPIAVEVIVENADRKPLFRVEIPSGSNKPYCTAAGTYKIRGNGRTLPLLPSRLLAMFMASENQEFVERFKAATRELERGLADTKARLMEEIEQLLGSLALLDEKLETLVAVNGLGERGGSSQGFDLVGIEKKMDALLERFEAED